MSDKQQRTQKALVLSGGGGRGAYHIGVLEALVEQGWMQDGKGPDIIAGTSIGAINAAAIASGLTIAELKQRWMQMHTEDVHRLSKDLPVVVRPLLRFLMRNVLTSEAHGGAHTLLSAEESSMTTRTLFERMGALFRSRSFRSLLDTTPWRTTLRTWMDFDRINSAESPALLLAATELQGGALHIFCNRPLKNQPAQTLTLDHLMASSSIPIVYPWTEIGEYKYWDGAVLANTPLGPVIDLAGGADVDILVVIMSPWNADPDEMREYTRQMPEDLVQGLTLTLDWTLLASYRTAVKMLKRSNQLADAAERLARAAEQTGDESLRMAGSLPRRISEPTVIAPEKLMPLEWIIDYEEANHQYLFQLGKADALRALSARQSDEKGESR